MSIRSAVRRLLAPGDNTRKTADDATFRALVEQSGDMICRMVDGRFTYVSPSATRLFGLDPEAMIGTEGFDVLHPDHVPLVQAALRRRAAGEASPAVHQVKLICGDGSIRWAEMTVQVEQHPGGYEIAMVVRDISERKQLELELESLAMQDGLTGLANRRCFDNRLEAAWRHTLQEGGQISLLLIDVDHFKQFNDRYGHQAGDDCLRVVAGCLTQNVRSRSDLACRYGGEELAIIMPGAGSEAAMRMAERLRASVAALTLPLAGETEAGCVTISIGVGTAFARTGGSTRMPESLLQAADHALYKAKAGGRDRVEQAIVVAPTVQA